MASKFLQVCADCIRSGRESAQEWINKAYKLSREKMDLPCNPPRSENGILCNFCFNECKISPGEIGFCGIRKNEDSKIVGPTKRRAKLHAYYDPNPTNCCAAWFCPATTGCGYPNYTSMKNGEHGTLNYSIFFYGCNFNCLFCQNESHKTDRNIVDFSNIDHVLKKTLKDDVTCVCFFGGSPEPHFPFALNLCRKIIEEKKDICRICWEWNGGGNKILVKKAAEYSLKSGGIVKFDLKAFNPLLAKALLGVSVQRTYENFKLVGGMINQRPKVPLLTATTLLVPYYIDAREVEHISKFIAEIDREIPYSMLIFHSHFFLSDLPITPIEQVKSCYKTAKKNLKNVHIGNLHLLGLRDMDLGEFIKLI